jgi:hypothetical protein
MAEEVGHQGVCHYWCFLVRDGVNLWPLSEVVYGDQELSISPLILWGGSHDVQDDPLNRCLHIVLLREATSSGLGASACCADVTLLKPSAMRWCIFFYIGSYSIHSLKIREWYNNRDIYIIVRCDIFILEEINILLLFSTKFPHIQTYLLQIKG